jgi:hypothetical protein
MRDTEGISNPYCLVNSTQGRITPVEREVMIRELAYRLAEHRDFVGGRDLDDWLLDERLIDAAPVAQQRS